MKKFIAVILCGLPLWLFGSCYSDTENYGAVYNYMQSLSLLNCGEYYVKTENNVPCFFDVNGNSYTVTDNAVELSKGGIMRVLHADSSSFFYSTVEMADSYGKGNGYRIYRYYTKTGKKTLVYSDVSVTNFDSILGLEDVFDISAPSSGHSINHSSLFYIDGDTVIPDYEMKKNIAGVIEATNAEIELSSLRFKFAVTNNKVLFTDVLGKLWIYSPQTRTITQFCPQPVSDFFVTENNVFVLSGEKEEINVFDVYAHEIKNIDIKGIAFSQNSIHLRGNQCFLRDDEGRIWFIDENADMYITLFKANSTWCINGSEILLYDSKPELLHIESGLHKQHEFKVVKTKEPTCIEVGKIEYACVCGNMYEEEISMLPHTESQRNFCTDKVICVVCKTVLSPSQKHEMSFEGAYNNDATCNRNGTETFACQNCPYTETKETENTALAHEDTDTDNLCDRCGAKITMDRPVGFMAYLLRLLYKLLPLLSSEISNSPT